MMRQRNAPDGQIQTFIQSAPAWLKTTFGIALDTGVPFSARPHQSDVVLSNSNIFVEKRANPIALGPNPGKIRQQSGSYMGLA
jgi:hypothetical protein